MRFPTTKTKPNKFLTDHENDSESSPCEFLNAPQSLWKSIKKKTKTKMISKNKKQNRSKKFETEDESESSYFSLEEFNEETPIANIECINNALEDEQNPHEEIGLMQVESSLQFINSIKAKINKENQ